MLAGRTIDYGETTAQKSKALQYPPDLTAVGGAESGEVSLSEYRLDKVPQAADVAPADVSAKVVYRRSGNLRWLTVEEEPAKVWGRVRLFWTETLGFPLAKEEPRLGVMETDWLSLREAPPGAGVSGLLDQVLNRVYDSGERDKFRVRMEETGEGSTDIYITHRHSAARFAQDNASDASVFSGFEALGANTELEVEMLRRLMLHIAGVGESADGEDGVDDAENETAREIEEEIAAAESGDGVDYELKEGALLIHKPAAESWPLVFIGLDRGGFSVEDRDFVERAFYIRHSGGGEEGLFGAEEKGFFDDWFGGGDVVVRELKITLAPRGDSQTAVTVAANDDEGELTAEQSRAFLDLLLKNLP